MKTSALAVTLVASAPLLFGCNKTSSPTPATGGNAKVGAPAPDFELTDLDGKPFKLADQKGKRVVLEWFNPECPFVKKSHTVGSLIDTAKRHTASGVVWVAINSNAPGKQGHDPLENRSAAQTFGMSHPILRDETGKVGKLYGAQTTPHMFVIDEQGTLVYAGAIDNSPDGERESPKDGKLVNYVDAALTALSEKKPVPTPTSEPYGCSVKYAN